MYNPSDEVQLGPPKVLILPKPSPQDSTSPTVPPPPFWTLEQDLQEIETRENQLLDAAKTSHDFSHSILFSMLEEASFPRRSEAINCIIRLTLKALSSTPSGSSQRIGDELPFAGVIELVMKYTLDGVSQGTRYVLPLASSPIENELRRGLTALHLLIVLNYKLPSLASILMSSPLVHDLIHLLASTDVYFETVPLLASVMFLTRTFTFLAECAGLTPMDTLHPSVWVWMEDRVQEELTRRANRWRLVAPWRPTPGPHNETRSVLHSYSHSVTPQSISDGSSADLADHSIPHAEILPSDPTPSMRPPASAQNAPKNPNDSAAALMLSAPSPVNAPLALEIREWFTHLYKELLPVSSRFVRLLVRIFFASLPSSSPVPPPFPGSPAAMAAAAASSTPTGNPSPLNIFSELVLPSNIDSGGGGGTIVTTPSRMEGESVSRAVEHQEQFLVHIPRLALAYLACATHSNKLQGHAIRLLFVEHNMLLVMLKFLTVDFEAYLKLPSSAVAAPSAADSISSDMSVSPQTTATPPASPATPVASNTSPVSASPIGAVNQKQRSRRRATVTAVLRLMAELVAGSDVRVKSLTRFRAEHTLKRLLMTCANPRDPQDHHLLYAGYLLLQLLLPLVPGRLQGPLMPLVTMMYNHNPPLLPIPFVWPPPPPALPGTEADAPSQTQELAEAKIRSSVEQYNRQLAASSQPTSAEVHSAEQLDNAQADEDYWYQLSASADEWLAETLKRCSFEQLLEATFPHLSNTGV